MLPSHSCPRARHCVTIAVLTAAVLSSATGVRAQTDDEPSIIAVVVGKASRVTSISKDELRELYLRRQRVWPNGARAVPINLPPDHPARQRFSRLVLGRSPNDLLTYWSARYFEGIMPPTVVPSPTAVRAYLAAEPDAIAYLPASEVDDTCRVVLSLEH